MTQQNAQLSPETILAEFNKNGVTHVVTLPDSETNWLYLLMDADPTIDIIPVSREGRRGTEVIDKDGELVQQTNSS
mgnify:CR=1 FL=1